MSFDNEEQQQDTQKGQEIQVGKGIKRLREERSISLKELADRTGLSSAVLSQIENHLVSPPLGTVVRIAKAFDIRPSYFFDQHPDKSFTIVRKDERKPVSRFASNRGVRYGYSYESLGHDMKDRHMEPFLVTLEPTTVADPKPSAHEGEEFLFVLEGEMKVTLGEHSDILQTGDAIYYDSTIPHLVICHGGKETKILAVIYS